MNQIPPSGASDGAPQDDRRVAPLKRASDTIAVHHATAVSLPSFSGARPLGATPGQPVGEDLTVSQLLRILLRRWMVALPVFLAILGFTWWRYSLQTPMYEAVTTIRIDKSKEAIPGMSSNSMLGYQSPYELSTEIQVLQSRAIAREVVAHSDYAVRLSLPRVPRSRLLDSVDVASAARIGHYTLTGAPGGSLTAVGPSGTKVSAKPGEWFDVDGLRVHATRAVLDHEQVLFDVIDQTGASESLRGSLKVTQPVRDAEVLRLTVRDPDPRLAARTSDAVAEAFTSSQTRRRQAGGRTTVAFIRAQLDSLDRDLVAAEVKLRDWRAAQKVVVPGAEAGNAVALRAEYEGRLAERRQELQNIETLLGGPVTNDDAGSARIQRNFRAVLSSPVMKANAAGSSILSTLLDLEAKRAELKLRRTDEDPEVKVLDKTIADYQQQGRLFVASYVSGLQTEISGYGSSLGRVGSRLERFPGQELELTTLQRNAEVLATLQGTLRTRLKEAEITNASNEANVELLDRAIPPASPVSPVLSRYVAVGTVAGFLLALLAAVLRDRMDRTIHSREDIERATGAALVGLIPSFDTGRNALTRAKGKKRAARPLIKPVSTAVVASGSNVILATGASDSLIAINAPRHVASEAYRMLRTNLRFAPTDQPRQVLSVSSPSPGDGKSTTALNFAATVAVQGKRVLLVDGDMRRGTQHKLLGIDRTPGLSNVLSGRLRADEAARTVQLSDGVTLDFIASGDTPPNPTELLGGSALAGLLSWARGSYDMVVLDTPPVNMFADGLLLAAAGDALVLVGRAGKSFRDELAMAAEQVRNLNVPIAGVVLNDYDVRRDNRFGSAYYYYDRYYHKHYAAYMTDEHGSAA